MQTRRALGSTELVILRCLCGMDATDEATTRDIAAYAEAVLPDIRPGHLQTVLTRLKDKCLLVSRVMPRDANRVGRPALLWSVTDEGRAVYAKSARLFAGETSPV